ncbi:MAG: hypothetical protein NT015_01535 [Alphaproteobacteria bacterium]|nr:hypothetical protein [Alphaproteobacteria bacterium]
MKLQSVLNSPDQYLQSFDGADAVFFEMDRDAYSRSIFLDRRIAAKSMDYLRTPLADLLSDTPPESAPISYIFHIAHCGSTLLARALDLKSENLVLREPYTLRQLGVDAVTEGAVDFDQKLRLAQSLLARRYNQSGPVIVKANVPVNCMIPALMDPQASRPAIFLHYGLEDYLLAILRAPMHRNWVQNVTVELKRGVEAKTGAIAEQESVPAAAARLWLWQMLQFQDALAAYPNAKSLGAEELFENPKRAVAAAFELFGQKQSAETVEAIVGSELFTRYSKDPRHQFDNAQRVERRARLKQELVAELQEARGWVLKHPAIGQLQERLARPLSGEGCSLLG